MRAAAAARAVLSKPLEADEQVAYDKIKSGVYKSFILNPQTGEMEPLGKIEDVADKLNAPGDAPA